MPTNEAKAREIWDAITLFQDKDEQAAQARHDADIAIAEAWFDTQGIDIQAATTRAEALSNFKAIKNLLRTETDPFRKDVLRKKLNLANEKFKERKRNG